MKKVVALFCSLILMTGCSLNLKNDNTKVEDKTFDSYNGKFQITANSNWKATSQGELNENADIEIADDDNQKYLISIMESKEDLDWDYKQYSNYILKQNAEIYETTIEEVKTTKINDYDIDYVELKSSPNGVNIYMRIYVIETKNYYGQILIWTKYSQRNDVKEEFDKIVSSFIEK